jgi:hypothetical protein
VRLGIIDCSLSLLDKGTWLKTPGFFGCGGIALKLNEPAVEAHDHDERVFGIGQWIRRMRVKIRRRLGSGIEHTHSAATRTPAT